MNRYTSLRWKLTWLIAGGSVVSASIAAAGFAWFDLHRVRQNTNSQVSAIAAIVASQLAPAITLKDSPAASEILRSLAADNLIQEATLYDRKGRCFAWFYRSAGTACTPKPKDGFSSRAHALVLARPVTMEDDRLGTLALVALVPSIAAVLREYLDSAALIFFLSLVVAAVVAMVLQRRVSEPILSIAHVAEQIAHTHRFNDRVTVSSSDELGVLAESFNSMLGEIERRDAQLARQRLRLEAQVDERNRVNGELRVAKDKAEEAARLKSQFLANMSHEIRTPMNGVVGMLSLVLERCTDKEEREQLAVAQTAAQSLVSLLNDILDLSKIEAGRMTVEAIDFDLRAVVHSALQMFEILVRDKKLELRLECDTECPGRVRGDPVRLRQVLINLVGNAVKFTSQGSISLDIRPSGTGRLRFAVKDTGIGIEPGNQVAIFDAFTQADGSTTRRFGGTGLGLTITRRLVNLMGGELHVDSSPGHGSCFFFELPLAPSEETVTSVIEPSPIPRVNLPNLRVLVAEDNAINQKVIGSMLRRQGWVVTLAATGKEACECFSRDRFDLVLMDVQMPEMDGLTASR